MIVHGIYIYIHTHTHTHISVSLDYASCNSHEEMRQLNIDLYQLLTLWITVDGNYGSLTPAVTSMCGAQVTDRRHAL